MTIEIIDRFFPLLAQIESEDLRDKTRAALQYAVEKGGWSAETITLCPMTMNWKGSDTTLLEHINTTAGICLAVYREMEEITLRHAKALNLDLILSGALLHDIGKFLECRCVDGVPTRGDTKIMRHPLSGAIIAARFDLPDKIIQLIAMHGYEGDKAPLTPEGDFVKRCDILAFYTALYNVEQ